MLVRPTLGGREIGLRDRIEVVVGQQHEAESAAAKGDEFPDDGRNLALPRLLSVGPPHRAERAMLRAATHGLHRAPHVAVGRQQIPAGREKLVPLDPTAVVLFPHRPGPAIGKHGSPDMIAIACDHGMGGAALAGFVRKQRRVNAAKDDKRASLARELTERVATQGVGGVDANPHHIASVDPIGVERLECLVDDVRHAVFGWRGSGQHVEPSRRDDRRPERQIAWIDQMNAHSDLPF